MVRFLSNNGTNTVVGIGGLALACLTLGALAWASDYRAAAIVLFIAGGVLLAIVAVGIGLLIFHRDKPTEDTPPVRGPRVDVRADHGSMASGGDMTADHGSHIGPVTIGTLNAALTPAQQRDIALVIRQLRAQTARTMPHAEAIDSAAALERCADQLGLQGIPANRRETLGGPYVADLLPEDLNVCLGHWEHLGIVELSTAGTYYLTEFGRHVISRLIPALRISDPIHYPRETAETIPRSHGSLRSVKLWRVSVSVAREGTQANNVTVQIERASPAIMFLPVVAHEMHQNGIVRREARNIRYGDPPVQFDIISMENEAKHGEPRRRVFIYRNEYADPYELNKGEIGPWWEHWDEGERVELTITAVPDLPESSVSETYELWTDEAGDLQMEKRS